MKGEISIWKLFVCIFLTPFMLISFGGALAAWIFFDQQCPFESDYWLRERGAQKGSGK